MDQFQLIVLLASGALTIFAFSEKMRSVLLKPLDERFVALTKRIEEVSSRQEEKILEMDAMICGLIAILHDLIYGYCEKHIKAGEISIIDKKNLEILYDAYSRMGGNGTGHDMYMDVCELPIKFIE